MRGCRPVAANNSTPPPPTKAPTSTDVRRAVAAPSPPTAPSRHPQPRAPPTTGMRGEAAAQAPPMISLHPHHVGVPNPAHGSAPLFPVSDRCAASSGRRTATRCPHRPPQQHVHFSMGRISPLTVVKNQRPRQDRRKNGELPWDEMWTAAARPALDIVDVAGGVH